MFTMEVPYVPVQDAPIVMAQATASGATTQPDYLLKTCEEVPSVGGIVTAMNLVDPAGSLAANIGNRDHRWIDSDTVATIKITQLQGTTHGKLILDEKAGKYSTPVGTPDGKIIYQETGAARVSYIYESKPGYVGKDKAVFLAEFEGKRYKIVIDLVVSTVIDENSPQCPPTKLIKVSKPTTGSSGIDLGGITLNIADLPGGAVGETTGTSITLDTNAAGYGWYVDPNPASNSDFLPTSNPDVWMAKAGSAAAGKMDMLSVLLHEYGHALGLDHSVNPNDFMAPNLQPGERRLPSSAELAQLSQLSNALSSVPSPLSLTSSPWLLLPPRYPSALP